MGAHAREGIFRTADKRPTERPSLGAIRAGAFLSYTGWRMNDLTTAALFGWEEVQALSGWVGLVSFVLVLAGTEYMRRTFATQEDLERECQDRKTADEHRDREQHRVSELVQQFIGRGEIMERRQEKADRAREREVAALREEVRTGFARIEAALERRNRNGGGK